MKDGSRDEAKVVAVFSEVKSFVYGASSTFN